MKKISAISEIPTLIITRKLINQVTTMLAKAFDSTDESEQTWADLNCQLWHITNLKNLPTYRISKDRLLYAIEYPEWIESVGANLYSTTFTLFIIRHYPLSRILVNDHGAVNGRSHGQRCNRQCGWVPLR